ncbi:MAG: acriflavine resistance protein B [Planctomycetes bacterium GWF2_41_51]|nr:MAG: acriflavine resistance protein B [Planctomycetes bacterium GWF2_41_51]HBG26112.1 acriflavine resistance protein B [Phycisphaerales bacterium]
MDEKKYPPIPEQNSLAGRIIGFCIYNKLIVLLITIFIIFWGVIVAPFDWDLPILRNPVPVDAIPDIGENQQIVFTDWPGRSPKDVDDQVTYPLTTALMGVPGVKTVRSYSMFGFSSIYIIFDEKIDFYWSRSRVLEKLNALPSGTLPQGIQPMLGPDATALGQVFWYTLEGRDEKGNPTGGWDLDELRSTQDWLVRYALLSSEGISEVASIGGFVKEYQIDVDPDAMRAYKIALEDIYTAIRNSNVDVGAKTIEINRVEYIIRGLGFIKNLSDIENTVVKVNENVPVYIKNIAKVAFGPALRRGAIDKSGAEAVGGIVIVRYGFNPLEAIKNVKKKIVDISPGLPKKTLPDGTVSQIKVVPYYDRTGLIYETLGTLNDAIFQQVLITVIVIIIMVNHLRSSILISLVMPLAVLGAFIGMKFFKVDANIVALSGIAIAIGTIVDMGIVICENILRHLNEDPADMPRAEVIHRAASEVGSAVVSACASTIISFIPIFFMTGPEGKLFRPLAFTKTFALVASIVVAITVIPPAVHVLFFAKKPKTKIAHSILAALIAILGVLAIILIGWIVGLTIMIIALYFFFEKSIPVNIKRRIPTIANIIALVVVGLLLTIDWEPLGAQKTLFTNFIFVALLIAVLMTFILLFQHFYEHILRWCLNHKLAFLSIPLTLMILGAFVWSTLGKEFMPPLDEGSFLYMPTTMPHASIGEALDIVQKQDAAISSIPEVDMVVGKIGRAESALDPAPVSMIETVINYKDEYVTDQDGRRLNFKFDKKSRKFVRDANNNLIPDEGGRPYRQWREHIKTPDDIWHEITVAAQVPGTTSAPKLQPIAARLVMLQSGMRAPMGIKIKGPNLRVIEQVGFEIERLLKQVPAVEASTVIADRIVGKPYLEIEINRQQIARYGISIRQVQDVIEVAIGGDPLTTTVEGRERYPVRVRYMRELRDSIETIGKILVPAAGGAQIPLIQLADIKYVRGPQEIKSEDTFLVGYILFDKLPGMAEVDVVEQCKKFLEDKIAAGELIIPKGISYTFAGSYENQLRAARTLALLVPLALFIIFIVIYFQFRSVALTLMVFVGVMVAWSGAFLLIGLYGQSWFMNFSILGINLRELFHIRPINLSVAVWVGFLALFGVADDDGVVMGTYLVQTFRKIEPKTIQEIREATITGGKRRVRAALMTTATTILALLPVFTALGRGADIMVPMAIPSFGGMTIEILTMLIVPVLYCALKERQAKRK